MKYIERLRKKASNPLWAQLQIPFIEHSLQSIGPGQKLRNLDAIAFPCGWEPRKLTQVSSRRK